MEQLLLDLPLRRDYKMALATRLFLLLLTAALVLITLGVAAYFIVQAIRENKPSQLTIAVLVLPYGAFFIYSTWATARSRLYFYNDEMLYCTEAFSTKKMSLEDIAGYTTSGNYTYLYSTSKPGYRLKVSKFVDGYAELRQWLDASFFNLDITQAIGDRNNLLNNTNLGRSPEERAQKLHQSKRVARLLNTAGIALSIWLLVLGRFREYYEISIAIGILFPWCVVLVLLLYRGLIGLHDQKEGSAVQKGPVPSVLNALLFPPLLLVLRTFFDYYVLEYDALWAPALSLGLLLAFALLYITNSLRKLKTTRYGLFATIAIASLAYGYGTIYLTNCLYDTSPPERHWAQVLDKKTTKGKTTTYYFTLSPWGNRTTPEELKVPGQVHGELQKGDSLQIRLYPGWLSTPWYECSIETK